MSLKEKILASPALKEKLEEVPEWGVSVLLKEPDGECRASLLEVIGAGGKDDELSQAAAFLRNAGKLLQPCLYDPETKEPIFTPEEHALLGSRNPGVLQRLFLAVIDLAGLSDEADKEIKAD